MSNQRILASRLALAIGLVAIAVFALSRSGRLESWLLVDRPDKTSSPEQEADTLVELAPTESSPTSRTSAAGIDAEPGAQNVLLSGTVYWPKSELDAGDIQVIAWRSRTPLDTSSISQTLAGSPPEGLFTTGVGADGRFELPVPRDRIIGIGAIGPAECSRVFTVEASQSIREINIALDRYYRTDFEIVDALTLGPPRCAPESYQGLNSYQALGGGNQFIRPDGSNPLVDYLFRNIDTGSDSPWRRVELTRSRMMTPPELKLRVALTGYDPLEVVLVARGLGSEAAGDVQQVRVQPVAEHWGRVSFRLAPGEFLPPGLNDGHRPTLAAYAKRVGDVESTMALFRLGEEGYELPLPEGKYSLTVAGLHDLSRRPVVVTPSEFDITPAEPITVDVSYAGLGHVAVFTDADGLADSNSPMVVQVTAADESYGTFEISHAVPYLFGLVPGEYSFSIFHCNGIERVGEPLVAGPLKIPADTLTPVVVPMQ